MSKFGDAFKAARAKGSKPFEYNGKMYSTARADDKPGRGTDPDYGRGTKVTKNNLAAANLSSDPIAALNSQKRWTGPGSDRRDDEAGMSRGTRAADPRDKEKGMSRGSFMTNDIDSRLDVRDFPTIHNYPGNPGRGGQGGASAADTAPDARAAEAGMSRGTRAGARAGRGGQGGRSMEDVVMDENARYDAGAGQGLRGTGVEGYKKGGRVTGFKGYGKAKKV